jgi:hypothetical protein
MSIHFSKHVPRNGGQELDFRHEALFLVTAAHRAPVSSVSKIDEVAEEGCHMRWKGLAFVAEVVTGGTNPVIRVGAHRRGPPFRISVHDVHEPMVELANPE